MDYHLTWYKCPYWDLCAHIQEYIGYRSNNLYFLFSHSWPVVVYNSGQVQRISQVERKNKCSKKTTEGDIAVLWTALLLLLQSYIYCLVLSWYFYFEKFWIVQVVCLLVSFYFLFVMIFLLIFFVRLLKQLWLM